jgi:phage terminase large subunit-like protein
VSWDDTAKRVRLIYHRIFQPRPDDPLDFEATIEQTLLELRQRFRVRRVLFDPWQMQAVSQRLQRAGVPLEEFPQTSANLTAASQNLYELIQARNLLVYPDQQIRLAISRAVAIETARGWRIAKEKQSHKIDVVVALAMAAHASVTSAGRLSAGQQLVELGRSEHARAFLANGSPDQLPQSAICHAMNRWGMR